MKDIALLVLFVFLINVVNASDHNKNQHKHFQLDTKHHQKLQTKNINERFDSLDLLVYIIVYGNGNDKAIYTGWFLQTYCSLFNTDCEFIYIIHDWPGGSDSPNVKKIMNAYKRKQNCLYFILVDYHIFTANAYDEAQSKLIYASNIATRVAKDLNKNCNVSFDQVTCIGIGLGAHACGTTGRNLEGKINTIYGLDPTADGYSQSISSGKRLAQHVLLIRTSNKGIQYPIGNSTFIAGNGLFQEVCKNASDEYCSHNMAVTIFAAAIQKPSDQYKANNKEKCVQLLDKEAQGIYYFPTNTTDINKPLVSNTDCNYVSNYQC